jgi:hypothetical protein
MTKVRLKKKARVGNHCTTQVRGDQGCELRKKGEAGEGEREGGGEREKREQGVVLLATRPREKGSIIFVAHSLAEKVGRCHRATQFAEARRCYFFYRGGGGVNTKGGVSSLTRSWSDVLILLRGATDRNCSQEG